MNRWGWLGALLLAALLARGEAAGTLKRTADGKKLEPKKTGPVQKGIVVEDAPPRVPPVPPPPAGAAIYEVGRVLSDKHEVNEFPIQPGLVRKVEVTWHDDLGGRHKAKGRVYVDRVVYESILLPTIPDDPGSTRADIESRLHTSTFLASRPILCRGKLILLVNKDDAFVQRFKVYYGAGGRLPPHAPRAPHAPRRPPSLRPVKYQVVKELDDDKRYYRFPIQRGVVSKVDVFWKDDLGKHDDAKGRVYLNRFSPENLLEPHNPDPRYRTPTVDIGKKAHISTFDCRRPMRSEGSLLIQVLEDKAKVYNITVYYLGADPTPPPQRPIKQPKQPVKAPKQPRPNPKVEKGEKVEKTRPLTLRERLKKSLNK